MSEKTEPPSDKKIRDAREKGQFLFSREIVSGAILIAITALFLIGWKEFAVIATYMLKHMLTQFEFSDKNFYNTFWEIFSVTGFFFTAVSAAVYATSITVSIIANISQTGVVFSAAKIKKGVESLNFINNAKQMFSPRNLFNFLMNLVKVILISYVSYLIVTAFIGEFFAAELCGLPCVLLSAGRAFGWLFAICAAIYIPIAILDFIIQRAFYLKELKMTKEEVKQEYKEMEGSPEIKARRRQAHREILDDTMLNSVRQASVIIKNPTHYAVALLYDGEKTLLPLVIGKGEGAIASEMIKIAEQEDIPVYEDIDLARGLFSDIELGHYITTDFIAPVAEALIYIQQMKQR